MSLADILSIRPLKSLPARMKTSLALRRAGRSELIELSLVKVIIGARASD
jgi:hypothetical protein